MLKAVAAIFAGGVLAIAGTASARADLWQAHVAPLLREHCTKCHGGAKQKGGLDLRSVESALAGGESGEVVRAGDPARSLLFHALQAGADPHMPPKGQLEPEEIELLGLWIEQLDEQASSPPPDRTAWTLPAGVGPTLAIDTFLARGWRERETPEPASCDDATFVRRIYLDLLGRIPTFAEREAFRADTGSRKRGTLIGTLLASKAHARHFAEVLNVALLGREDGKATRRGEREAHLLPYLRWCVGTNRPWDQMARDMIVGRPEQSETRGASWFLYEQRDDPNKMATATAAALLGKQVQCAQCHDHPIAPEIGQRHYHALVAFFSRTRNVSTPTGPALGESASGGYSQFANLEGDTSETRLEFFDGTLVEEPGGKLEKATAEHYDVAPPQDWLNPPAPDPKTKKVRLTTKVQQTPVPKFSRRSELARVVIEENPEFPKAFVNRVWAILLGRGIVDPVDKMDSAHPPSHPELLEWLAADFAASGYNTRRLMTAILSSRAYQASAFPDNGANRPAPESFAYALDKPLAAEPLYRSMLVALGVEPGADGSIRGEEKHRAAFLDALPSALGGWLSPKVQHAMFVTNSSHIDGILGDPELPLVAELGGLEADAAVEQIFVRSLGRAPDSEERQHATRYLAARADRQADAIRQLLWAIFASAEFHINH